MNLQNILTQYPADYRLGRSVDLGAAGGLSGAGIWRIESSFGDLCLRRWPVEHPDPVRLKWIHAVLKHVDGRGVKLLPIPLATLDGGTFVSQGERLWELAPWLPGHPVETGDVTAEKVTAAFDALARFHLAAESFTDVQQRSGRPPSIEQRLKRLELWQHRGGAEAIETNLAATPAIDAQLGSHGRVLLTAFHRFAPIIETELGALRDTPTALQPCIRDIHDRHVLFTGDRVTGLIDFGAMRVDTVATDVARLLGTLPGADAALRAAGMAAYQRRRRLSDTELRLAAAIDRANEVLRGMQWLQWLVVEQRQFPSMPQVLAILSEICRRLPRYTDV